MVDRREEHDGAALPSVRYRVALVAALTLTFSIGFADRQILNLLVEPIKADFRLSDVQISILQGVAFSAGYLLFTPLLGRCIDIFPRTRLLAGAIAVWSGFTLLCAFAGGFRHLLGTRAGVGAAEGALTPAVYSLLGDSFDDRHLPLAFSIVLTGPYIGGGAALLLGGLLIDIADRLPLVQAALPSVRPWQFVFIAMSIPGFFCAIMMMLFREPRRRAVRHEANAMPLHEVAAQFRANASFYLLFYLGMSLLIIPIYAFPAWVPAFMGRRFGLSIQEVGYSYGLLTLVCGISGVLAGPWLARHRLIARDDSGNLRFVGLCGIGIALCCAAMYAAPSPFVALAAAGLAGFFYSAPTSLAASALQIATPARMRGVASSIYVVTTTLAGLMLAPFLVAALTQYAFADESQVGSSLAIVGGISGLASALVVNFLIPHYRGIISSRATGL
jgi:MFS family permease